MQIAFADGYSAKVDRHRIVATKEEVPAQRLGITAPSDDSDGDSDDGAATASKANGAQLDGSEAGLVPTNSHSQQ